MPPEISIVLATYDRPDALARCLNALRLQTTPHPFEILVVDNHPQSNITTPLALNFPEVQWLEEETPGLSRARNLGIAAARGTVLVTTDDDVIPPPTWLATLTAPFFAGNDTLAATTGNCLPLKVETPAEALFESYGGLRHGDTPATFDAAWMAHYRIGFPQLWRIGTTANAAFRADILRDPAVGPFDIGLGAGSPAGAWEDLYCFYRILGAGKGWTIAYLPQATLLHAHRETLPALTKQLTAYRRGETAFLTTMLLRHHDLRALGQLFLWIPRWRLSLLLREIARRLTGKRRFSFRMFGAETLAYLAGPLCYAQEKSATPPRKFSGHRRKDLDPWT